MVCSFAMPSNCVWLPIIFYTCVKETMLFSFPAIALAWKWQIAFLPEDIHLKNKLGDWMIKNYWTRLCYRQITIFCDNRVQYLLIDWTSRFEPISLFKWPPLMVHVRGHLSKLYQKLFPKQNSSQSIKPPAENKTWHLVWSFMASWLVLVPPLEEGGGLAYFSPKTLWRRIQVIKKEIKLHVFTTHQEWKTVTLFSRIPQPPWINSNAVSMYLLTLYFTLINVQNVSHQPLMLDAK